jgi:nicotinamide-nucleotide amidase
MQVDVITIGDELLIGQVIDTNSAWMAQELNKEGFSVNRITTVSDDHEEILSVLRETTERSKIVLITGGLGPTRDDITKNTLCDFFNTKLVHNEQVLADVKTFLAGRVKSLNQLNQDQALVPESATVIRNVVGTAPILWFTYNGGVVVSMPGVPSEMQHAMHHEILPRLRKLFDTGFVEHKTILIHNIPEAVLAEMLSEWEDAVPKFIKVAYLPSPGKIRLRLSAKGNDQQLLKSAIQKSVEALQPIIGDNIYAEEDQSIGEVIINQLKQQHKTVSLAESCSGGLMAHLITAVPGASEVFKGSLVAYSNEIKNRVLGVNQADLDQHGAVSRQVVEQMAKGAVSVFKTDFAVATSGIAGPTGASKDKPVGTVWIAWASAHKVVSECFQLGQMRDRVIMRAVDTGLIRLKKLVEDNDL